MSTLKKNTVKNVYCLIGGSEMWNIVGALCCVINGHTTTRNGWSYLSVCIMYVCMYVLMQTTAED